MICPSEYGGTEMNEINFCPRCGGYALEHFATHSNCWECGFSPDFDSELSEWERIEFPNFRKKSFKIHHVGQPFHLADLRA